MSQLIKYCLLSMGIAVIFLTGCDKSIAGKDTANHTNDPGKKYAQSPGKPGASVRLEPPQPYYLEVPGVANLELRLSTTAAAGKMLVDISAGDDVVLLALKSPYEFALSSQKTYAIPLQFSVAAEGRYYINVRVSIVNGEHIENRVMTAIVQVGAPVNRVFKNQGATGAGSEPGVIELPAEESIGPE